MPSKAFLTVRRTKAEAAQKLEARLDLLRFFYRYSLRKRALNLLRKHGHFHQVKPKPKRKGRPVGSIRRLAHHIESLPESWRSISREELFKLRPEELGMNEHRLKGHFIRLSKDYEVDRAWQMARAQVKKDATRSRWTIPIFTSLEKENIRRWKPRKYRLPA